MRALHPLFHAIALLCLPGLALLAAPQAQAGERGAVVVIDQAAALAGGVTPGDEPGFPVTLGRAGHYQLAGDLTAPADTSGIDITASGVTLDLSGHAVRGPVRCTRHAPTKAVTCDAPSRFSAVVGIRSVGASGAVIRNGTVEGFAGLGVHYGEASVLEQLQVRSNAGAGIAGMGYATPGALRDVRVARNGGPGIVCAHMRIERSTFADNGGTGVDCRGAWFSTSVARGNGGAGVAEGPKAGLRSHGNRLKDEPGVAADRVQVHAAVAQGMREALQAGEGSAVAASRPMPSKDAKRIRTQPSAQAARPPI